MRRMLFRRRTVLWTYSSELSPIFPEKIEPFSLEVDDEENEFHANTEDKDIERYATEIRENMRFLLRELTSSTVNTMVTMVMDKAATGSMIYIELCNGT